MLGLASLLTETLLARGRIRPPSWIRLTVRLQSRTAERELARLASRSHGVVTRRQLLAAGVTRAEIGSRVRNGALIQAHPGVYHVGHRAPSVEAAYLAAVWACGDGALLSGKAAAHLWGLVKGPPPAPEVTAPTERRLAAKRSARVCAEEATEWRGVPVTNVPWTLVDLAPRLTQGELARACHEAGVKHKTTPRHVEQALARQPNAPGAAHLRSILFGDVRVTLSRLEAEFVRIVGAAGLPPPLPAGWLAAVTARHAPKSPKSSARAGCSRACASAPARAWSAACAGP